MSYNAAAQAMQRAVQCFLARKHKHHQFLVGRTTYTVTAWGMSLSLGAMPIVLRQRAVLPSGESEPLTSIIMTGNCHSLYASLDMLRAFEKALRPDATPDDLAAAYYLNTAFGVMRHGTPLRMPFMLADSMTALVLDQRRAPDWRKRYASHIAAAAKSNTLPNRGL